MLDLSYPALDQEPYEPAREEKKILRGVSTWVNFDSLYSPVRFQFYGF